ncbi:MAG: hypothetical protein V5A52_02905 [Halovenus sp.]
MGIIPDDFVLMPVDDDATYVNHIYLIVIVWMMIVILAGFLLVLVAL